jgi:SAM-dependent methyltransferase
MKKVRFGDLHRFAPFDPNYGFGRGTPIDRYYIDRFMEGHQDDVRGRVLEIETDSYTERFGGGRVTRSDVLNVTDDNPRATIVADLTKAPRIRSNSYDCIIFTQTLQYIFDVHAAVATLRRILRPGGVLLATFPGISRTSDPDWGDRWCWSLTSNSARLLFREAFPDAVVQGFGNLFGATAFLHGLALEDVRKADLDVYDAGYEITIAVRATKKSQYPG